MLRCIGFNCAKRIKIYQHPEFICSFPFLRPYSSNNDESHTDQTLSKVQSQDVQFQRRRETREFQDDENDSHDGEQKRLDKEERDDERMRIYDSDQVRLSSSTESSVPDPCSDQSESRDKSSSNFPEGQRGRSERFLSRDQHDLHQSKHFSSLAGRQLFGIGSFSVVQQRGYGVKKEDENVIIDAGPFKEDKYTIKQKMKMLVKDYGSTVIVFHTTISLISLGICYTIIKLGLPVHEWDIALRLADKLPDTAVTAGTFGIAYALHKCFAIPRVGITGFCVPLIVRSLRRKGILKPPKTPHSP